MKNERQAHQYLTDQAARTCPPCTGACNQGRQCPSGAYYTHEVEDQSEGLTWSDAAWVVGGTVFGLCALGGALVLIWYAVFR